MEIQNYNNYYLVLDFEANCSGDNKKDHEIIEFPCIVVNSATGEIKAEFRTFVRLVNHDKLSEFAKDLTGITDEQVNSGISWADSLVAFEKWCHDNNIDSNATIVTCGDWDLGTMLPRQLNITKTKLSPFLTELFGKWHNVITSFKDHYKNDKRKGLARMLEQLDLSLDGKHHSGIDDCKNIVKICQNLLKNGVDITKPNNKKRGCFGNVASWFRNLF